MVYARTTITTPTMSNEAIKTDAPPIIPESPAEPTEAYKGETTFVADTFSIKVPNGWTASVSNSTNFLAIMFARPNQLTSLIYNRDIPPAIDPLGIPSWSGLTEHFFVIAPTVARQFNQNDHQEVSSEPFTFDDGFVGQKHYVVKHATEAQQYGGLQEDSEWQGRTYIYEKDSKRIEAHLALYPSTAIDLDFYENVVRTLQLK